LPGAIRGGTGEFLAKTTKCDLFSAPATGKYQQLMRRIEQRVEEKPLLL
jgi:hypothetical protein